MYRPEEESHFCRNCGKTMFEHPMSTRRYYNNPDTRAFFEELDKQHWWQSLFGIFLFLCFVPIALVARLFGWRPDDD